MDSQQQQLEGMQAMGVEPDLARAIISRMGSSNGGTIDAKRAAQVSTPPPGLFLTPPCGLLSPQPPACPVFHAPPAYNACG